MLVDKFMPWSWLYMLLVLLIGEVSREAFAPGLHVLEPTWPNAMINLIAALPGFVPMWVLGYWLFRRMEKARRCGS